MISASSALVGVPWLTNPLVLPRTSLHGKATAVPVTPIGPHLLSLSLHGGQCGILGGVDGGRRRSFSSRIRCERSRESGGYSSGESTLVDQLLLERELQIAIEEENYAKAAKIRDDLKSLQEDSNAAVMAANAEFYNSFKNGDVGAMQALWSKGDHVCCVHPGALGISGHETVVDSWIHVWANYEFPLEIELREVRVHVRGDVGYVTCVELVKTRGSSSWGGQFVTNVFERINGKWFICVHYASPVDF
ncbi:hypothetical protein MLD38_003968 [Melastoma candidum]|uniref:Uncharacterized protein n=1 Tax=Melastoma candidum TaxID=119954 RepID=A0ACB9S5R8_9MYRT|nr:hypothetical protein MLD38_003968 [Melastoma candidum]